MMTSTIPAYQFRGETLCPACTYRACFGWFFASLPAAARSMTTEELLDALARAEEVDRDGPLDSDTFPVAVAVEDVPIAARCSTCFVMLADDEPGYPCPACGELPDYCAGHGETGDPDGALVLANHDREDHSGCHLAAECLSD